MQYVGLGDASDLIALTYLFEVSIVVNRSPYLSSIPPDSFSIKVGEELFINIGAAMDANNDEVTTDYNFGAADPFIMIGYQELIIPEGWTTEDDVGNYTL